MTAAEPPCGFSAEDYRRTYEAHGRDEQNYCLGFHWDRGVAWPCDVRTWAEVALDVITRSVPAEQAGRGEDRTADQR